MDELERVLEQELSFLVVAAGYEIIKSGGTAIGNAVIDLGKGDLRWRLVRSKGETSIELFVNCDRDYPAYSTDILMRWLGVAREDASSLVTTEVARWLEQSLSAIEAALERNRAQTVSEWERLKKLRSQEIFG